MPKILGALLIFCTSAGTPELPPLSDLDRFPCWEKTSAAWKWHCDVKDWADGQEPLRPGDLLVRQVQTEVYQCWQPWYELREAQDEANEDGERRRHLARVKELIGPEAYRRGRLPCPVPWWRFPERD